MTRLSAWLVILWMVPAVMLVPTGCETMQGHERTAIGSGAGAATGAIAGAVIGNQSGNPATGAVIGGATGALLGGGVGYVLDRRAAQRLQQIPDVGVEMDQPAPAPGQREQPGPRRMTLRISSDVLFEQGSSALSSAGDRKIAEIANVIKDYPDTSINVRGYASSEGSDAANVDLSQRRANVVADTLVKYRISQPRINQVRGMGSSNPVADNETESGRVMNRRVEIEVFPTSELR